MLFLIIVEAGHNALVFNKITGLKDKIYVPGTHIRIPMLEKVIDYEIRPKPTVISSLTGSKGKFSTSRSPPLQKPSFHSLTSLINGITIAWPNTNYISCVHRI